MLENDIERRLFKELLQVVKKTEFPVKKLFRTYEIFCHA